MQVCNFICIFAQMKLKTIHLEQTDSTNRWLREHMGEADADITVVTADYQTAGRGQGSNTWESEEAISAVDDPRPGTLRHTEQLYRRHQHQMAERYLLA